MEGPLAPGGLSRVETVDVATGRRTLVAAFDALVEAPNWARDGRLLVNSRGRLYWLDGARSRTVPVYTGDCVRCNNDHVLAPSGGEIAFSCHAPHDGLSRVYRVAAAGGRPRLVTPLGPSYLHGWSPDGRTLAYCAERDGAFDVYAAPADGGPERRLTDAPGLNDGPEFSPDGQEIWFNSVRTGLMQIWRMRADGSEQRRATVETANCWFPHIAPDGSQVAYLAYRQGEVAPDEHPPDRAVEIRVIDRAGGPSRTLAALWGGQGTLNVNSWSPDSRSLAFVSYRVPA